MYIPRIYNKEKYDEIINCNDRKVCVIAGPGTGKTQCILIPKAQEIIKQDDINPDEVLILSFSRLSANDLKEKVKKLNKIPKASTLHSFCLSFLLSEDNHDIRERIDTILLDFEKDILVSDLKIIFPYKHKRDLKKMLNEFSAGWAVSQHDKVFAENEEKKRFKSAVVNWLTEFQVCMMEEIVYNAADLARKINSDSLNKIKYIFVDEFQDLNKLEQEFVEIMSNNANYTLVIGDPDQSIYSFKYAFPTGISDFSKRPDVTKYSIDFCGRCARKILKVANQLLLQMDPGRAKELKCLPNSIEGEVYKKDFGFQQEEFSYVLNSTITEINNGTKPKDIIILVPKKKLGKQFTKYANNHNKNKEISFKFVVKNDLTKLQQKRILLLGLIVNPNSISRFRGLIGLEDEKGFFSKELSELKNHYGNINNVFLNANPEDFAKRKKKIRLVCKKINELKKIVKDYKDLDDLDEILDKIFPYDSEELRAIRNILNSLRNDDDNLEKLYLKFVEYSRDINVDENTVRVMTLMGSKGLEANCVFIIGCNDGNIPGENRSELLRNLEYKQEQRRLLYVGITRAKEKLHITWSRFIDFKQSKGHYTKSNKTYSMKRKGIRNIVSQVGLSEFLQDIDFS
jgi:DNA helicase II / ATP-dependent DNA helicase PcrA